jgi:hypothetical protein
MIKGRIRVARELWLGYLCAEFFTERQPNQFKTKLNYGKN